jgi:4-hydroxy-tetrahydrodipicolinate synthase
LEKGIDESRNPTGTTVRTLRLHGVFAPVLTPFQRDLAVDAARLTALCRWLLSRGCAGLAVFGTTSEANSLSVDERARLLEHLLASGIEPGVLMPGTGCCAIPDTVRLTGLAVRSGCAGVLMLPPFYYKGVSEDGLFASVAEVIQRVGDDRLRVYLYHIPPVAQVGFTPRLVERLLAAYPRTVAGMKDSSGDWSNTQAMLTAFSGSGFDVFVGSERFLLANLRAGGVGCITATANVNPAAIARLYRDWQSPHAESLQEELNAVRAVFEQLPAIPALKAVVAHESGDPDWRTVRPPLVPLAAQRVETLLAGLRQRGFEMPGFRA